MDVDGAGEDQAAPRVPTGRAGRAARRAGTLARAGAGRVRTAASADGAGESGMSALLGTHALSSAGDALVAVALAGTVFFAVPLGEARDRVAKRYNDNLRDVAVVPEVPEGYTSVWAQYTLRMAGFDREQFQADLKAAGGAPLGIVLNRTRRPIPKWLYRWLG